MLVALVLGQALQPGTGTNVVDSVHRFVVQIAHDAGSQIAVRRFVDANAVAACHRLAQTAADAKTFLDDPVQAIAGGRGQAFRAYGSQ